MRSLGVQQIDHNFSSRQVNLCSPTFYVFETRSSELPWIMYVPIEDDRFFLVAGVGNLHEADAEAVNRRRLAVKEDLHLKRRSRRHVEVFGDELTALSDAHAQNRLGSLAFHLGGDVEVPEARTEVKAAGN